MITATILFILGFGIIAAIISVAVKLLRFVFSLPIIGTLAVIFIILLFFRVL